MVSSKFFVFGQIAFRPNSLIYLTGTEAEGECIHSEIPEIFLLPHVSDVTGKFSLPRFIGLSDGLVAASTGPLHIAAASGVFCLGLFPSQKPIYAERWGPIGKKA